MQQASAIMQAYVPHSFLTSARHHRLTVSAARSRRRPPQQRLDAMVPSPSPHTLRHTRVTADRFIGRVTNNVEICITDIHCRLECGGPDFHIDQCRHMPADLDDPDGDRTDNRNGAGGYGYGSCAGSQQFCFKADIMLIELHLMVHASEPSQPTLAHDAPTLFPGNTASPQPKPLALILSGALCGAKGVPSQPAFSLAHYSMQLSDELSDSEACHPQAAQEQPWAVGTVTVIVLEAWRQEHVY
jgi:hypothetical protein